MGLRDWWRSRRRPPPATPGGIGAPVVTPTEKATLPPSSKAVTPAQQQVPGRPSGGGGGSSRSPTPTIHQDLAGGTTTPTGTSISGTPQPGLSNAQLQAAARQQQQTPTPSAPSNAQLQDAARRRQVEQQGFVGGTAFLTKQEAARAGIVPTTAPQGTPKSLGQLQIEEAERGLGKEQGSSGAVATTPRSRPDFKHRTRGDRYTDYIERQVENVLFTPVLFPEGIRGGSLPPDKRAETIALLNQNAFLGRGSGAIKGLASFPVRHPVKTGVLVGVSIAAPYALGYVGAKLTAAQVAVGNIAPAVTTAEVGTFLGFGAATIYGGMKINQFIDAPDYVSQGRVLGETVAELAILGGGSKIGAKGKGLYKTIKYKQIEYKNPELIPKTVRSGKDRFVYEPGKTGRSPGSAVNQYKLFQQTIKDFPEFSGGQPIGFHTTAQLPKLEGGAFVVKPGFSSEFQGLYGSYRVSPNFLRIPTGKFGFSWDAFNVFNTYSDPTILVVKQSGGIQVAPYKSVSGGLAFKHPKFGVGQIPGLKSEVELINIEFTNIQGVAPTPYWHKVQGVRVPIFGGTAATGGVAVTSAAATTVATSSSSATSAGLSLGFAALGLSIGSGSVAPSSGITSAVYVAPSSSIPSSPPISSYIPSSGGGSSSGRSSPSRPSPSSPPSSPSYPPSSSSPPSSSPALSSYYKPSSSYRPSSSYTAPKRSIVLPKFGGLKLSKPKLGKFTIFGKRFGKFKPVGTARTPSKAFRIGTAWAGRTLGASFKIPGTKKRKIKGFITKKTKEGIIYIEPKKRRLKKRGKSIEIPEIQYWKKVKK